MTYRQSNRRFSSTRSALSGRRFFPDHSVDRVLRAIFLLGVAANADRARDLPINDDRQTAHAREILDPHRGAIALRTDVFLKLARRALPMRRRLGFQDR